MQRFGGQLGRLFFAVAEVIDLDGLSDRRGENQLVQKRQVFGQFDVDRLAAEPGHDVAGPDSRLGGRRAFDDARHQRPAIELVPLFRRG